MATASFDAIFSQLRDILSALAPPLSVKTDKPGVFQVNAAAPEQGNGKEMLFGYLKIGKGYVSYHLMPLYDSPGLLDGVSPELPKRMQGKTCFNFKQVDEALFNQLKTLTERTFDHFQGQISVE